MLFVFRVYPNVKYPVKYISDDFAIVHEIMRALTRGKYRCILKKRNCTRRAD